jgi:hypothetical protein
MNRGPRVGDIVLLKDKYKETSKYAIVVEVDRIDHFGDNGWTSFDYTIMTENGDISHVSLGCFNAILFE